MILRLSQNLNFGLVNARSDALSNGATGALALEQKRDGNIHRHSLIHRMDLLAAGFTWHGECQYPHLKYFCHSSSDRLWQFLPAKVYSYRRTGFNCENLIIANCKFF